MSATTSRPTFTDLSPLLIDDPIIPSRESMDDEKLHELVESVRDNGILQPLVVEVRGDRYGLMAGHRRLTAARILNLATVPCAVYAAGTVNADVVQTHENSRREDVNAAEEAERFERLYRERCGEDVDKLCELVGESRYYVESRLILKQGDPDVFQAVKSGLVNQTIGVLANKIATKELRNYYLDAAIKGGVSARVFRDWIAQADRLHAAQQHTESGSTEVAPTVATGTAIEWACPCCLSDAEPFNTVWVQVHRSCWDAILIPFMKRYQQTMGFDRDAAERAAG